MAAIRGVGGVGARPTAVTVGVTLAPPPAVALIVVPPAAIAAVAPLAIVPPPAAQDNIDAVSVIGVVFDEWRIRAVTLNHSGDDGFELTNASIAMDVVRVFNPVEDGANLSTSLLQTRPGGRLEVDMITSTARDREIFDFEADTGPVQLWIARTATVDIQGHCDNRPGDLRIDVRSPGVPRPSLTTRAWYAFNGPLPRGRVSSPSRGEGPPRRITRWSSRR